MNADDDEAVIQPTERTRDNSIFGKVRWKFDYLFQRFKKRRITIFII